MAHRDHASRRHATIEIDFPTMRRWNRNAFVMGAEWQRKRRRRGMSIHEEAQ